MPRTTEEDFKVFEKAVRKWVDVFALHEWELRIKHDKIEEEALANCVADQEAMNATIKLNKQVPYKMTGKILEDTALHEVLELLLWIVTAFAPDSYPKYIISKETHTVIQKFINAFKRGVIKL